MKSLIVGASAGLGRALAERLAGLGHELFLVSSDAADLEPLAADLKLRHGNPVHVRALDLAEADPEPLRTAVLGEMGGIDNLFYVAGVSIDDDSGPIPDDTALRLMSVNFVSGVRVVNAFLGDLAENPNANIVGMGSVAAGRGRRNNSVYGAAKRGLEFYFETLRHYLAAKPCAVQFYRLGYLETRMTFGQKLPFPVMHPDAAAARICANLGRDLGAVYLPWWWFGIMTIIKLLPWTIFRKLEI